MEEDVKNYRDAILDEIKDRVQIASDNMDGCDTQDEQKFWEGYAAGMSDMVEVVSDFFDLFINTNKEE